MTKSDLVIEDIKATAVLAPLVRPLTTAHTSIPAAPLVLIDVECSAGIIGRAYIFGYAPVSLRPLLELIANVKEFLIGKKVAPFKLKQELDAQFRLLGRQGLLGMALAGLDMAFWDALGKSTDMSVAALLGGSEDAIPCYDSHGMFNAELSPKALELSMKQGFKAVKFKVGGGELQADFDALTAVRDIIGPNIKLMIDYNQSLTAPEAIRRIRRLSEFDLHWVEEPVPAEDHAGHATVRENSDVSIQTGENWWFAEDTARAIAAGICDHAMLDLMKIGGVTGWIQAAPIVDAASIPISSHIFIEASTHVMAVTPRAHLLEYLDAASLILAEPYEIKDGMLAPRGPGLGIDWNKSAVEKYAI